MALFFDAEWFDARLKTLGLWRGDLGHALNLSPAEVNDLFKDQRELSVQDVRVLAALLNVAPATIAERAGVSTPIPDITEDQEAIRRLEVIERELIALKDLLTRRLKR